MRAWNKSSATMSHVCSCHRHLCHMKTHTSYDPCSTLLSCHLGCGSSPPFIRINRQEEVTDAGKNTTVQRNGTTLTGRVSLYEGAQAEKKHAGKFSTFLENKFSVFWVSVLQQLEGQSRCGSGILWDQRRLLELVLFLTRHLAWMANDLLGKKLNYWSRWVSWRNSSELRRKWKDSLRRDKTPIPIAETQERKIARKK